MQLKIKNKPASKTIFILNLENETLGTLPLKVLKFFFAENKLRVDKFLEEEFFLDEEQQHSLKVVLNKYWWQRLCDYLALSEQSEKKSQRFLQKKMLSEKIINKLLSQAKKMKYIDDVRFANLLINKSIRQEKSEQECKQRLYRNGISPDSFSFEINKAFEGKNDSIIAVNLEKALIRYKKFSGFNLKNKCVGFMIRRGFLYENFVDKLDEMIIT